MTRIDLTSLEWRELIFQGKNKEYGAYKMRSESEKRHNLAMLIVAVLTVVGFNLPRLFQKDNKIIEVDQYGPTILSNPIEKEDNTVKKVEPVPPPPEYIKTVRFVAPKITEDDEVPESVEPIKTQDQLKVSGGVISTIDENGSAKGTVFKDQMKGTVPVEKEEIFINIEQMPVFPGGEHELLSYIGKNLNYPVIDQENNVQGKVILRFVVSKTGMVDKVEVLRSLSRTTDNEAIRVVKSLPKFIPGRQNGANVSVWYTLPVTFKLQE